MRSERLTIGTHPDADVTLVPADETYEPAPWQAELIFLESGAINLYDYGSKHGTFYELAYMTDSKRVNRQVSVEFDTIISFGGSHQTFVVEELWYLLHDKINRNPMFPPSYAKTTEPASTPTDLSDLPPWHGIE